MMSGRNEGKLLPLNPFNIRNDPRKAIALVQHF